MITAPVCQVDGASAVLMDDKVVYGRSFGRIWKCPTVGCDRYVGAHPDGRPKGTLANASMRRARQQAHAAFDFWWQSKSIPRSQAYRRLSELMGIADAHISSMNEAECRRVIDLFTSSPLPLPDDATPHGAGEVR